MPNPIKCRDEKSFMAGSAIDRFYNSRSASYENVGMTLVSLPNGVKLPICEKCIKGTHDSYGHDHRKVPEGGEGRSGCKNLGRLDGKLLQCACHLQVKGLEEAIEHLKKPMKVITDKFKDLERTPFKQWPKERQDEYQKLMDEFNDKSRKNLKSKDGAVRVVASYLSKIAGYDRNRLVKGYRGKFVIHEHDAEKAGEHWDIRLEFPVKSVQKSLGHYNKKRTDHTPEPKSDYKDSPGSVYRSFVTKKMSIPDGKTKYFLVETEDHPMSYGTFEGTIPEGYGAGDVSVLDKGSFELLDVDGDSKYVFDFKGNKLKGKFAFVKFNNGFLWVGVKDSPKRSSSSGVVERFMSD